ncbi:MAG: hypothetical protein KDK39_16765 [Leptospiraceae bacterium]|nr:hypothetical protein [Leptospiraceae bacterium]
MNTPVRGLARFLLALGLYSMVGACSIVQTVQGWIPLPEFQLDSLSIAGIDLDALTLRFTVNVKNPYVVDIPHAGFDVGLALNQKQFTRLRSEFKQGIAARGSQSVQLDARIPYQAIVDLLQVFQADQETIQLNLDGDLDVYLPTDDLPEFIKKQLQSDAEKEEARKIQNKYFDKYTFDVAVEKNLPAILPEVTVSNFTIKRPSLQDIQISAGSKSGSVSTYLQRLLGGGSFPGAASNFGLNQIDLDLETSFDLQLSNRAAAALELVSTNYELHMAGYKLFSGQALDIARSGNTSSAKIQTSFPLRSISLALAQALHSGQSPIRLKGSMELSSPGWSQQPPLKFSFDRNQALNW